MKPSSVLNACKSLHLLNVDTAVRKTVFHVKHFKEILCIGSNPCENEMVFIGTVLELSGTHFNGTFWDNHLIPINPNVGIIWY